MKKRLIGLVLTLFMVFAFSGTAAYGCDVYDDNPGCPPNHRSVRCDMYEDPGCPPRRSFDYGTEDCKI